jgi:hypothetical protein
LVDLEDFSQLDILDEDALLLFSADVVGIDEVRAIGSDPGLQVLDVLRVVEEAKFFGSGCLAVEHVELGGEVVVVDEAVDHLEAHGLHGMLFAEDELGEVGVVEVADLSHC